MDVTELLDSGDSNCKDCGLLGNCSDGLECQLEEPMFRLVELVCVTVICIPLMLLGLLGNTLTILVVWLRPHMRSSTYLYLSSMAVSDMLILLLLPLDLYKLWRPRPWSFGVVACKLSMFLSECCTFCTVLHITFLSLERYLAVCRPITAKTFITRRRTRALIGCLWLSAAVSAAPVLVMVGVEEVGIEQQGMAEWRDDGGWTEKEGWTGLMIKGGSGEIGGAMDGIEQREEEMKGWTERGGLQLDRSREEGGDVWEKKVGRMEEGVDRRDESEGGEDGENTEGGEGEEKGGMDVRECRCTDYAVSSGLLSAMMFLSNLYFLLPLSILGVVYSLIGRTLCLRPQSSRRDQNHKSTVKMLGVIVLTFVLCWLPFHIGRTLFSLSRGNTVDAEDAAMDTIAHVDSDMDGHVNVHAIAQHGDDPETLEASTNTQAEAHITQAHTDKDTQTLSDWDEDTHTYSDQHSVYILYSLSQYFNLVSFVLFYVSAAVNPLLYNLMSARYRHAVNSLIHVDTHAHTRSHCLLTVTAQHSTATV